MKSAFDTVSFEASKLTTRRYSTSFSLGIRFLDKELRNPIYSIYGFVRFADEIVDSFQQYNQKELLAEFKQQTFAAIEKGISLNPILNSFQNTVNRYEIPLELIESFFASMELDLQPQQFTKALYEEYILGSAEVVGLMCLKLFVYGDQQQFNELKASAMKLGSAFQKINFLRDMKSDYHALGRIYFPGVNFHQFTCEIKREIEQDILKDFEDGYEGMIKLPKKSRLGVYVAYVYYFALFRKIQYKTSKNILSERVRISNTRKFGLLLSSMMRNKFNWM